MMNTQKKNELEHVTGLRAVAILLVLLFHMDGAVWGHAYVGVDVFFVISGFLMLRARQQQAEPTSWRDALCYMGRRARRIIPPMAVVVLLAIGAAELFFTPRGVENVCKVGERTCVFVANVLMGKQLADYFAPDKDYMPLLHMWYLSVVMQVYALYTVGNLALQRLPRRLAVGCVVALGALSLLYCYSLPLYELAVSWGMPQGKELFTGASYYSVWGRVWEVAAGGLALLLPEARSRAWGTAAAGLGLLLVLAAAPGGVEPGQLPAVAGAVLLLRYVPQSRLSALLTSRPLLWLGGISFSLYLVHMPVFVYWRMWLIGDVSAWDEVGMLVGAALLGWGYWWAVEKRRFPRWLVVLLYAAALLLSVVGHRSYGFARYALPQAPLHHSSPVALHVTRDARLLAHSEPLLGPWVQNTYYAALPPGEREKPPVLELGVEPAADTAPGEMLCLMGDSHASHLVDGLAHHLRRRGRRGVFLASIMVPFHGWDFRPNRMPSYQFNPPKEEALYRWLAAHPEITRLVIGCRWAHQIEAMHLTMAAAEADLRAFLRRVRALGKQVVLVAPVQEFGVSLTLMPRVLALRGIGVTDARFTRLTSCSQAKYREDHAEVLEMLRRMEAEGLCSVLCVLDGLESGECIPAVEGNTALYGDTNHYTPAGSIWFINKVGSRLEP